MSAIAAAMAKMIKKEKRQRDAHGSDSDSSPSKHKKAKKDKSRTKEKKKDAKAKRKSKVVNLETESERSESEDSAEMSDGMKAFIAPEDSESDSSDDSDYEASGSGSDSSSDSSSSDEDEEPELVTWVKEKLAKLGKEVVKEKYPKQYKEYKKFLKGEEQRMEAKAQKQQSKKKKQTKKEAPKAPKKTPAKKPTAKPKAKPVESDDSSSDSDPDDGSMDAADVKGPTPSAEQISRALKNSAQLLPEGLVKPADLQFSSPAPTTGSKSVTSAPPAPKKEQRQAPATSDEKADDPVCKNLNDKHFSQMSTTAAVDDDSSATDTDDSDSDSDASESDHKQKKKEKKTPKSSSSKKQPRKKVEYTVESFAFRSEFRKAGQLWVVVESCPEDAPVMVDAEGKSKVDWKKVVPERHFFHAVKKEFADEYFRTGDKSVMDGENIQTFVFTSALNEPMVVNAKGFASCADNFPSHMNLPEIVNNILQGQQPFVIDSPREAGAVRCIVPRCALCTRTDSEVCKKLRSLARKQNAPQATVPKCVSSSAVQWMNQLFDSWVAAQGDKSKVKLFFLNRLRTLKQRVEHQPPVQFLEEMRARATVESTQLFSVFVPALMNPAVLEYMTSQLDITDKELADMGESDAETALNNIAQDAAWQQGKFATFIAAQHAALVAQPEEEPAVAAAHEPVAEPAAEPVSDDESDASMHE